MTAPQTVADVLDALADRCEAATLPLPNRVLNRDIARAMGWGYQTAKEAGRSNPAWFHPSDCRDGKPVLDSLHGTDVWREPIDYVGSLDAAVQLVPKGMSWSITDPANADGSRSIFGYSTRCRATVEGSPNGHDYGPSPSLALCVAALRAAATSARQETRHGE